jgi:hypothetical protein
MADIEHGNDESPVMITRREAILRVSALLGGVALVGGSALLTGCREGNQLGNDTAFTPDDVAFLDEVAETILPQTSTPGAKAAKTGAFMALIVTDSYSERDQKVFRAGMRKLDDASRKANGASFMAATPAQRLALLQILDKEQKAEGDVQKAEAIKKAEAFLSEKVAPVSDANAATAITAEPPRHYFRMMKELALLGYFTSEIGCTQAQRYVESPGRFEPCLPYKAGEKAWAPHA